MTNKTDKEMTDKEIFNILISNLGFTKEEIGNMESEEGKTKFNVMNALAVFHKLVELTNGMEEVDTDGIEVIRNILYTHAQKKGIIEWDEQNGFVLSDTREKVETLNI